MSLESLKNAFPWPDSMPKLPPDPHGWFSKHNIKMFKPLLADAAVILEVGSWLGLSARFWLQNSKATVICIDTWQGSEEHFTEEEWASKLPKLYETFCVNQWQWRNRLIPIKKSSVEGLHTVASHEVAPDLIYIDASHSYEDVLADITAADMLFPKALIVGDDWNWKNFTRNDEKTVQAAVKDFCKKRNYTAKANHWAWVIERNPEGSLGK